MSDYPQEARSLLLRLFVEGEYEAAAQVIISLDDLDVIGAWQWLSSIRHEQSLGMGALMKIHHLIKDRLVEAMAVCDSLVWGETLPERLDWWIHC